MATAPIDRIAPTRRPAGKNDGVQRWRDLLFVHWEVPVDALRACVPAALELDLWEGKALVGVVPFRMEGVRPRWLPPALAQDFLETNVRVYVTHQGRPGVYFFSLDAASWTAVQAARLGWSLPYFHARMHTTTSEEGVVHYRTQRCGPASDAASLEVHYTVGAPLAAGAPDSLEFFLLERYLLFVERGGRIHCGQVHHTPYPAHAAELLEIRENLIAPVGLTRTTDADRPFCVHYSPGVDVEVFGFQT